MKKLIQIATLFFIAINCFGQKKSKNNIYINDILKIEEIYAFLSLSTIEDGNSIRIFDMNGFFEPGANGFYFDNDNKRPVNVFVYKNLQTDLNTGKYRDLIIYGGKKKNGANGLDFYLVSYKCQGGEKISSHLEVIYKIENQKFVLLSKQLSEE